MFLPSSLPILHSTLLFIGLFFTEGDCDSDAQCQEGLKCFFRGNSRTVPGCSGDGVPALDYCTDPLALPLAHHVESSTETAKPVLPKPSPPSTPKLPTPTPRPTKPPPEPAPRPPTACPPTRDAKWKEICAARERLVECKQKVREEEREGRTARLDDVDVRGGANLKLYCRYSYLWQEKKSYCPKYCLEASDMKAGATLEIKDCSNSSPLQKFKEVNGVLRPAWRGGENLCIESDKLEKCSRRLVYDPEGISDHFEIILERKENKRHELCFSNPHHPKVCEPVRFSECKEARNSRTNYWTWA